MSEAVTWKVSEYSSLDGQRRGVAYDPSSPSCRRILEFSAAATEAEVRQVCALPEIMAALKELSEAEAAMRAALDEFNTPEADREEALEAHNRASDRFCSAHDALIALYERLK